MNNIVKVEGNTNVVIQDSKVDGNIIVSITDSSKIDDILENYKKELQKNKDKERKKEIKEILKSINKETKPIRKSLNRINYIINKVFWFSKITAINVFLLSIIIISIFFFTLNYFNSDKFLLSFSKDTRLKLIEKCCDDTTTEYCDSAMYILFKDIKNANLDEYNQFYDDNFKESCKYNFKLKKIIEDSIDNKEFNIIQIETNINKRIIDYKKYISNHDSTVKFYKACWDSIAILKFRQSTKANTIKSYNKFIKWCDTISFKGQINIDSLKDIAISKKNRPEILIIGNWILNGDKREKPLFQKIIFKSDNTVTFDNSPLKWHYKSRCIYISKENKDKYKSISISNKIIKLKNINSNDTIILKKQL